MYDAIIVRTDPAGLRGLFDRFIDRVEGEIRETVTTVLFRRMVDENGVRDKGGLLLS
jgi:hypothetical protein